jgi:hypothetical protein
MVDLVASVNDAIALREEMRIATILTTSGNFTNTAALSGSDRWDASGSDPIAKIRAGIRACWRGPGSSKLIAYAGGDVYEYLRQHPLVVDKFKYTSNDLPTRQQLAQFFGLDDLLVGDAWNDTANEGQTASYSRIWGKNFGILRVADRASIRNASFGYTFRFGQKSTTEWFDPKPGVAGGYYAKVGLQECHEIVAADAGYLYTTVIS